MKDGLSDFEKKQAIFWDKKVKIEDFQELDWPGLKERDDFFKFVDLKKNLGKALVTERK